MGAYGWATLVSWRHEQRKLQKGTVNISFSRLCLCALILVCVGKPRPKSKASLYCLLLVLMHRNWNPSLWVLLSYACHKVSPVTLHWASCKRVVSWITCWFCLHSWVFALQPRVQTYGTQMKITTWEQVFICMWVPKRNFHFWYFEKKHSDRRLQQYCGVFIHHLSEIFAVRIVQCVSPPTITVLSAWCIFLRSWLR